MGGMINDSYRGRVYRAEQLVRGKLDAGNRFEAFEEVEAYAHALVERSRGTFPDLPDRPLKVKFNRNNRHAATANRNTMTLHFPRWAWSKTVVCHEVAHLCTKSAFASHGFEFVGNFLQLMQLELGTDAATTLRTSPERFKAPIERERTWPARIRGDFRKAVRRRQEQQRQWGTADAPAEAYGWVVSRAGVTVYGSWRETPVGLEQPDQDAHVAFGDVAYVRWV